MPARLTQEVVVKRALSVWGALYDYSKFLYVNAHAHSIVICRVPGHGEFEVTPTNHIYGRQGCPKCGHAKAGKGRRKPLDKVIEQAEEIHGKGTYDYSKFHPQTLDDKGIIICKVHGEFWQSWRHHVVSRAGCPVCAASKGEIAVGKCLESLGESFEREARLIPNRKFAFDFYLPERRTVVEFHGVQHYKAIGHFGGQGWFEYITRNDRCKAAWVRQHGLRLIVVKYTCKDVAGFLRKKLNLPAKAA